MTLAPDTIEQQMQTLARQYTFLENVCKGLRRELEARTNEVERQDRLINEQRQLIVSLECKQCRCGDDDCSFKLTYWQKA